MDNFCQVCEKGLRSSSNCKDEWEGYVKNTVVFVSTL